ncbi:hypothetical protein [Ruegeria arenilitoris]|uniref:hypothetical protein n=1 Tax=Ruegeria arenilitoris TaxID=1173585 RepID=UPI00147F20D8|nr:hypothetical protein [Ruegeria arenilitoris]
MKNQNPKSAIQGVLNCDINEVTAPAHLAAPEYSRRKHRLSHPKGDFDSGYRFYLADEERGGCCMEIREPSRAYPYSEMTHGRSLRHVAELFEADELEVRRLAKRIESESKATS